MLSVCILMTDSGYTNTGNFQIESGFLCFRPSFPLYPEK